MNIINTGSGDNTGDGEKLRMAMSLINDNFAEVERTSVKLDENGKVPLSMMNDSLVGSVKYQGNYDALTNSPPLPSAGSSKGYYYVVTTSGTQEGLVLTNGDWVISNGVVWQKIDSNNDVSSVAGKTGAVSLTINDINGLQTNLNMKAEDSDVIHRGGFLTESITGIKTFQNTTYIGGNVGDTSLSIQNTLNSNQQFTFFDLRGPGTNDANNLRIGQWGNNAMAGNAGKVFILNRNTLTTGSLVFGTRNIERLIIGNDGNSQFTGRVSGLEAVNSNEFVIKSQLSDFLTIADANSSFLNLSSNQTVGGIKSFSSMINSIGIGSSTNVNFPIFRNNTNYLTLLAANSIQVVDGLKFYNNTASFPSLSFGTSTLPMTVAMNRNVTIPVLSIENLNANSPSDITQWKSVDTVVTGVRKDGRVYGQPATASNDYVTKAQLDAVIAMIAAL